MKKTLSLLIAFIMIAFKSFSGEQNSYLDSLESILKQDKISAKERLNVYDELSWGYLDSDFRKSSQMARDGINLARKGGNLIMEATLMRNLGVAYYMNNRLDSAETILIGALDIARETTDQSIIAGVYVALGNLYNVESKYDKAIENYNMALPIYEKIGRKDRVATIKSNIGALYNSRGNYRQAEKYLLEARNAAIDNDDLALQSKVAQNLSNMYFALSQSENCYKYANEAVQLTRQIGDDYNEVLALTSLSGACHMHLKDNSSAMRYAQEALIKAKKIDMPNLISASLRNITYAYYRMGDYSQAKNSALECIAITDSTDLSQLIAMNSSLLKIYINTGEKKMAEETFDKIYNLMTKQSDEDISYALGEMEIKYETEKKEAHIESLSKDKLFYTILSIVCIVAILLLITAIILLNRYQRQKRIVMEERLNIAEREKRLLAAQSLLDGENMERGRLSRELHDGLGGMLTMIKLNLNQMKSKATTDFDKVLGFVDNSIIEMRKMAHNIMPESIHNFGLVPTLTEFCNNLPSVTIHVYGSPLRYSENIEINFYRIASELVNNALKHAKALNIDVQLITAPDKISLSVRDNGVGFSIEDNPNALQTIQSRVEVLGANIDILSSPGTGTEVTVELNIKHSEND